MASRSIAESGGTAKGQGQGGRRQDRAEREGRGGARKEKGAKGGGRKRAGGRNEGGREEGGRREGRSKDGGRNEGRSKDGGRKEGRRGPSRCRPGMALPGTVPAGHAIFTGYASRKPPLQGHIGRSAEERAQSRDSRFRSSASHIRQKLRRTPRRPNPAFESVQRTPTDEDAFLWRHEAVRRHRDESEGAGKTARFEVAAKSTTGCI